jgi:hypothetical protein
MFVPTTVHWTDSSPGISSTSGQFDQSIMSASGEGDPHTR